eukprot:scaffold185694_cov27-Tisochrysis_lutea.AAC.1
MALADCVGRFWMSRAHGLRWPLLDEPCAQLEVKRRWRVRDSVFLLPSQDGQQRGVTLGVTDGDGARRRESLPLCWPQPLAAPFNNHLRKNV